MIITFAGISTSGTLASVNAVITTPTWDPPNRRLDSRGGFFQKHVEQYQSEIELNLVTPHRPLSRVRRAC